MTGFIDNKEDVFGLCKNKIQKQVFALIEAENFEHKYNLIYTILTCCDSDKKCLKFIEKYKQKKRTREELVDIGLEYS